MSKRKQQREQLARDLDAGRITQQRYDERMARMDTRKRGATSDRAADQQLWDRLRDRGDITPEEHARRTACTAAGIPRRDVKEWNPSG